MTVSDPAQALPVSDATVGLVSRTRRIDVASAHRLVELLPARTPTADVMSWVRRGEGMVGWGRVAATTAHGADRFDLLSQWWADLVAGSTQEDPVQVPGTGIIAFGSISFAAASAVGATLVVPEVVIGRRGQVAWVTTTARTDTELARSASPAGLAVPTLGASAQAAPPSDVVFGDGALSSAGWAGVVGEAVARITAGELDKVVLARDLEVRSDTPVDPRWLLRRLVEHYDATWVFAVDGLVGATPELLLRREKGLVTSRVLAGTIQRTGDDEHDLALAASLARSSKDLEEHEYAVRSVADALAPHCSSMNVPETPFVLHLANVMHLATDVTGVLVDGFTSLTLAAALHPTAAVCGTPTAAATGVIAELEQMDRGRYAGPVGWLDVAGDGEWGIALRCGAIDTVDERRMRLFAGCGIVAGSDPEAEVTEADAKFLPMRDALVADS